MSVIICDYVHPLLRNKMPSFFQSTIPKEFLANCHECNICKPVEASFVEQVRILGNSKCCNYRPKLPNFMVGYLLETKNTLFRARVFSNPHAQLSINPLGVCSNSSSIVQEKLNTLNDERLNRCTFYDNGRCGIWNGVNGICASWICYSIAGFAGRKFWLHLGQLLERIELELASLCLEGLGIDTHVKTWSDSLPETVINDWQAEYPDREQFYRSCSTIIKQVPKAHIEFLFKTKYNQAYNQLQQLYLKAFRTTLCATLTFNKTLEIVNDSGFYEIILEPTTGYGFKVNRFFLEALKQFDGRPITTVRQELKRKYGASIPDDQLLLMQNNEVLI
ncbi:hypothetical protein OAV92_00065 [Crocinitomicaceae bacterium]|nr:hypothetical protein [Crocinitomicaceae bacterium]